MQEFGSYLWFVGLAGGLILLAIAYVVSSRRRRAGSGDPNRAWKQEAAESGHPEVARPTGGPSSYPPPR